MAELDPGFHEYGPSELHDERAHEPSWEEIQEKQEEIKMDQYDELALVAELLTRAKRKAEVSCMTEKQYERFGLLIEQLEGIVMDAQERIDV